MDTTKKGIALSRLSVSERVLLARVRLFFGHASGNALAVTFGAGLMLTVFYSADIPTRVMTLWGSAVVMTVVGIFIVEYFFQRTELTIDNAKQWISLRMLPGIVIGMLYGMAPFLLPDNTPIQSEMFTFVILSAVITVATTSYSIMPVYYLVLNAVTMVPLTIYFALRPDELHMIMVVTAIIWQAVVLKNAMAVSKTSIGLAYLTEELKDETAHHRETKTQLEKMASQDSLTELPNRRILMTYLEHLIIQAKRYQTDFVVMFIDIDDFKQINDNYGHEAGDILLKQVASRLKNLVRESDMVARYGGDEFVLVSTHVTVEDLVLPERILSALAEPVMLSNDDVSTFGSIGIAQYPKNGKTPEALIRAADEAMYKVKSTGKSGFAISETEASH